MSVLSVILLKEGNLQIKNFANYFEFPEEFQIKKSIQWR